MMQHDEGEYFRFLKIIYCCKLHIICCCCCGYIDVEQLTRLDSEILAKMEKKVVDDVGMDTQKESSIWQTRDQSVQDHGINTNGMELSVPTTAVNVNTDQETGCT